MSTAKHTQPKASPQPVAPPVPHNANADKKERISKPAGNATEELAEDDDREQAHDEQATLQSKGPDALPGSDYPVKEFPPAANLEDKRQHNAMPGTKHRGRSH